MLCWGNDDHGQSKPALDTDPERNLAAVGVAGGGRHSCALLSTDMMRGTDRSGPTRTVCWGNDEFGQTAVPNNLTAVTAISAGYLHTCALRTGGGVRCWGDSQFGQVSA